MQPRVIGLDLSLTSTGLAHWPGMNGASHPYLDRLQPPKGTTGLDRLRWIRARVEECGARASLAVLEGPSYASPGKYTHERAGLWWIVYDALSRYGVPIAVVPPKCRAKYATGTGNAGKDEVLAAVVRRYPDIAVSGNDIADAWVLTAMGLDWLGCPAVEVPKTHREALERVAWPEVKP